MDTCSEPAKEPKCTHMISDDPWRSHEPVDFNFKETAIEVFRRSEPIILPIFSEELIGKWTALQNELKDQVIQHNTESWQNDLTNNLHLVAGLDISYPVTEDVESAKSAVACVVICSFPDLKVVHHVTEMIELEEPYIPGFLAFRESKPLVNLLQKIVGENSRLKPDVLLVDGNGLLHPRRYGCACHIGLQTKIPTIGVAKNIYKMDNISYDRSMRETLINVGDFIPIKQHDDDTILGLALKTAKEAKNPVFVSVGHKISLETAREVVMSCSKYRVPEPIRFADFNSRDIIRGNTSSPSPPPPLKTRTE